MEGMAYDEKISSGQFFILLMLSRIMSLMLYRVESFSSGAPLMLGLLISTAIEAIVAIPLAIFLVNKKHIFKSAMQKSWVICAVRVICAVYFVVVSALALKLLAEFIANEFEDIVSPVFAIAMIAIASAYCAKLGIEGLARAGTAVFWVFILFLGLMIALNSGKYDALNLTPVKVSDARAVWEYALWDLSSCRWLPISLALSTNIKHGSHKALAGYLITKLILIESVILVVTMVLWNFVDMPGYPVLALSVYAKTDIIHRFDAINMAIWAVNCVLVNGLYFNIASKAFKKRTWLSVLIPSAISLALAILLYKKVIIISEATKNIVLISGILLIGVVVPIIAIIYWRLKKRCEDLRAV